MLLSKPPLLNLVSLCLSELIKREYFQVANVD